VSSCKVPAILSSPILINRVFSTDTRFHENQFSWDRVVSSGQTERERERERERQRERETDRQIDEADSRFFAVLRKASKYEEVQS
jgi:hypothetical protein